MLGICLIFLGVLTLLCFILSRKIANWEKIVVVVEVVFASTGSFSRIWSLSQVVVVVVDRQPVSLRSTCIVYVHHQYFLLTIVTYVYMYVYNTKEKKISTREKKMSNLSLISNLFLSDLIRQKEYSTRLYRENALIRLFSVFIYLFTRISMIDRHMFSYYYVICTGKKNDDLLIKVT